MSSFHEDLSENQEKLLYLIRLYEKQFISLPHILVLVFEGSKGTEEDDDDEERPEQNSCEEDKEETSAFSYDFFESFSDIRPSVQVQLFSSMVLKNDLRYFKKHNLVLESRQEVQTGMENCYQITNAGRSFIDSRISQQSKDQVHQVVFAPKTTHLLSMKVKDMSFYLFSEGYERKSSITRPQELANERARNECSDEEEDELEQKRRRFRPSVVQQRLANEHTEADSKSCLIQ